MLADVFFLFRSTSSFLFLFPSLVPQKLSTASRVDPAAHKPLAPADFALPRPRKGTSAADEEAAAALEAAALEDSDDDDDGDGGGFRARAAVLAAKEKAAEEAAAAAAATAAAAAAEAEAEEAKRKEAAAAAAAAASAAAAAAAAPSADAAAAAAAAAPEQGKAKEKEKEKEDDDELVFELPSLEMPKDHAKAAAGGDDSENDDDDDDDDKDDDDDDDDADDDADDADADDADADDEEREKKKGAKKKRGERPAPASAAAPRPALDPLRWGVPNAGFVPRSARFHPQPAPSGGGLTSAEVAVVRAAREARRSWADAAALVPGRSAPAVRKLYALATGESVGTGSLYPKAGSRPHPSPFMLKGGGGAFVPGGQQQQRKKQQQQQQQQEQQQRQRGTSNPLFKPGSALPTLVAVEPSLFDAEREKAVVLSKRVGGGNGNGSGNGEEEEEEGGGNGDGDEGAAAAAQEATASVVAPRNTVAEAHGAEAATGVVFFEACAVEDADDPSIVYRFDLAKAKGGRAGSDDEMTSSSSPSLLLAARAHSACFNVGAVGSDGTPVLSWARLLNLYQLRDGTKWAETRVLVDADDFSSILRGRKRDASMSSSSFSPPKRDVTRLAAQRPAGRDADRELFLRAGRVHSRLQNVEAECWLYRCRPSPLKSNDKGDKEEDEQEQPPQQQQQQQQQPVKRGRGRPPKAATAAAASAAAAAAPRPGAADAGAGLPRSLDSVLPRGWKGDAWFWRHAFHPGTLEPVEVESDDEAEEEEEEEEEEEGGAGKERERGSGDGSGENDDDDAVAATAPATAATTPATSAGGGGEGEGASEEDEEEEEDDDEEGQPASKKRRGSSKR